MNYRIFWTRLTNLLKRSKAGPQVIVISRMVATVVHTGAHGSTKADLPMIYLYGNVEAHELEHLTSMSLLLNPMAGETLSLILQKETSHGTNSHPPSTSTSSPI